MIAVRKDKGDTRALAGVVKLHMETSKDPHIREQFRNHTMTVHNQAAGDTSISINVTGGQIGNLNLGQIAGDLDAHLSTIVARGGDEVAEAISELSKAILASQSLDEQQKKGTIEQVDGLAEQAALPPNERKHSIIQAVYVALSGALSGIADIGEQWTRAQKVITDLFGL